MESIELKAKQVDPFTQEWFRKRAMDSLQKTDEGWWDFSDSLLLYAANIGVEEYEQIQHGESQYAQLVTKPEQEYLKSIAEMVAAELPDDFDFIDLGPGTEHKEQFLFDALKKQGKTFRYIPVDVSKRYLELSTSYAQEQGIETQGIQSSFEELARATHRTDRKRFVTLGLTFSNYGPQAVLKMLRDIAGEDGKVFIDAHMRDRTNMSALQDAYAHDAMGIVTSKLAFLDLDVNSDIENIETDDGIRIWCTVKNPSPVMREKGVVSGDRMLMFQSLRYTKGELEDELHKAGGDYLLLDEGGPFIGAVLGA